MTDNGERVRFDLPKVFRIFVYGDLHHPYADNQKLKESYAILRDVKPTHVVQIGDLVDLYTFSRFSRSVNFITPAEEIRLAKEKASEFWRNCQKIAPNATCFQLRGNHCHRLIKTLLAKAPEFESMLQMPISQLTEFEGVVDMKSARSELELGNILFVHGWGTRLGQHRDYFGQNVVCGHSHVGGVSFKPRKGKALYELNVGHLADVSSLPLSYGETKTTGWVSGCGVIDNFGPKFIPI